MARAKVGSDMGQFRFPDGTFGRIEALGVSRPDFVRDAVLDRLKWAEGGSERDVPVATGPRREEASCEPDVKNSDPIQSKPLAAKRPERRPGRDPDRWSEQKPILLAKIRERSMDERTAARELGWNEGLVSRVATELSQEGLIRFERGLMVA